MSCPTMPVPQGVMQQHLGVIEADGLSVLRVGPDEPVPAASARLGFPGLLVPSLRRLLSLAGIEKKDHPRSILDMVAVLVQVAAGEKRGGWLLLAAPRL